MKKLMIVMCLALVSMTANAQMRAGWHNGSGKYVCAAYGYGKFTGANGKRHKYVPRGRKLVKGRSHGSMRRAALKNRQRKLQHFKP